MSRQIMEQQLKNAYGPVTKTFDAKLELTLARLEKEEEPKVRRKFSMAFVLATVAIFALAVAVATSPKILESFNNRSQHGWNNALQVVSDNADTTAQTIAMDALMQGVTFNVTQSYYDDTQLYFAYTIEGMGEMYDYDYVVSDDELSKMADFGYDMWFEYPEGGVEKINERLKMDGKAAVKADVIALMDGLKTKKGETLCITESDEYVQYGTLIGYRRFELRNDQGEPEKLVLMQQLTRHKLIIYYEGSDITGSHMYQLSEEILYHDVAFEAAKNKGDLVRFEGERSYQDYTAIASVTITPVDIQFEVTMSGTDEWTAAMKRYILMEDETAYPIVEHYALYANGERCRIIEGGMGLNGIAMRVEKPENIMLLELVPYYYGIGENRDDAILIDTTD